MSSMLILNIDKFVFFYGRDTIFKLGPAIHNTGPVGRISMLFLIEYCDQLSPTHSKYPKIDACYFIIFQGIN